MRRLFLSAFLGLTLLAAAPAQVGGGEIGLFLSTRAGSGGTICPRQFTCQFLPATLTRGETITLSVRGVLNQPYVVAIGLTPVPLCLPVPGVLHELMFLPFLIPFAGLLDQQDGILACPGGLKQLQLPIPQELAPGTDLVFQALAWSYYTPAPGNQIPTLTMAVHGIVQ